jgi:hypothetical protein
MENKVNVLFIVIIMVGVFVLIHAEKHDRYLDSLCPDHINRVMVDCND